MNLLEKNQKRLAREFYEMSSSMKMLVFEDYDFLIKELEEYKYIIDDHIDHLKYLKKSKDYKVKEKSITLFAPGKI